MLSKYKGKLILENGIIYDPYKNKKINGSILISDGLIIEIGNIKNDKKYEKIDCNGKLITASFIDLHAHFREPGREDKETLLTGSMAAIRGGFTRVCVMPNTEPPLDSPEAIRFIKDKAVGLPVEIFPIGAITKGQKGIEITEIGSMVEAGAIAISDDGLPVQNGQVMRYAIEYAKMFDIPVINHAEDICLRNEGVINEGALSTKLGLNGNPDISESTMVYRDLEIADYTNGRIHVPHVSTSRSVHLIREYKRRGVSVTAEVTPHHLCLTQEQLINYDTNAKVAPPLRTDDDRCSLMEGLRDGTIDCIATDHAPHSIEGKEKDFINAPCGMIGLESAFGLVHTRLNKKGFNTEEIIQYFTKGPSKVMGWVINPFKLGAVAELNIIDPKEEWKFLESQISSKSYNSPILGMEFKGRVTHTISNKFINRNVD